MMKIATLQLLIVVLLCSCASKPRTNTAVPSLDTAKVRTEQLGKDLNDYKGNARRLRALSEQMEYKASLIK